MVNIHIKLVIFYYRSIYLAPVYYNNNYVEFSFFKCLFISGIVFIQLFVSYCQLYQHYIVTM